MYQGALMMSLLGLDKKGFWMDKIRLLGATLIVFFISFACLAIAVTWIKIAGNGGKLGKVQLPKR